MLITTNKELQEFYSSKTKLEELDKWATHDLYESWS